jgi:hypothetical protein
MSAAAETAGMRLKNPPGYTIDGEMLRAFEQGLDPAHPERSWMPARVLGYGEISTVFAIEGMPGLAFKRLPIFETAAEMAAYETIYEAYIRALEDDAGIRTAAQGHAAFAGASGRPIFYIIQVQQPGESVGHHAMRHLDEAGVCELFRRVLAEMSKVWACNRSQERVKLALDAQVSNWAIEGFDPAQGALPPDGSLIYMDTSTPLFRVEGVEQLNPEMFLRSAPSFLRWVLRLLFMEDVVNRYYDFHRVVVDFIANFYKEQRPEVIPALVRTANAYFADAAEPGIEPLTEKEVRDYYQEDALIWRFYLGARRIDRWLHHLLRREYPYILPGRIRR